MSTGRRNPRIDLLRGLCILLVLLHHFDLGYRLGHSPLGTWLGPARLHALCRNGNYAVIVFFALSGFLITGNTLHRWGSLDRIDILAFYRLRVARILPCLLLLLATVDLLVRFGPDFFAIRPENGPPVPLWQADLAALTFTLNLLMARAGWFEYCLCVLWSLCVEEAFYLVFPLLCRLLRRPAWLGAAAGLAILVGPIFRATHQQDENLFLFADPACFDAIAIGCWSAWAGERHRLAWARHPATQAVIALLMAWLFLARPIGLTNVWGVTAMALGTAVLLLGATRLPPARAFRPPLPLHWLGRHSYELYLFHLVPLGLLRVLAPPRTAAPAAILPLLAGFLALSVALACLVSRLVAEPANRTLRRRWERDTPPRAPATV